jgi:4-alpha-glucanotransferase
MMFERNDTGRFHDIANYRPDTLVTFGTHDLASYAGWRSGHDIGLKQGLGIDPGESMAARKVGVEKLGEVLRSHGIDQCDIFAVIAFLARTPSRILAIMIEDLLNVIDQPNIPGTIDEHPNWRRKLPVPIEQFSSAIDTARLRQATGSRDIRGGSA